MFDACRTSSISVNESSEAAQESAQEIAVIGDEGGQRTRIRIRYPPACALVSGFELMSHLFEATVQGCGYGWIRHPELGTLNVGDPGGIAYEAVARSRTAAAAALAQLGEDEPASEAAIRAGLATLDLADSTMVVDTDENGRLRANGKLEMRAVDELERDPIDPSPAQSATAVLDKLSAAVLLGTRNRDARMRFVSAIVGSEAPRDVGRHR